ncbi:MAG: Undecaprenyl-phosphate 4-deoxy-4-formamido-L-arabinose transferase [Ignavibacteria bacterium]|nr:Undecaprenyl-phosphate 4-deoxy-4-formamido-L-arabinose transferase [Ignavibacteria bacterium]
MPKISVITTVFNCEKYIRDSVLSILNQTFEDFEYVIVNDGSTDNTTEILRELAKKDNRIILKELDKNYERVRSLNIALESASGDNIAIQDADDISMPDRLVKQNELLDKNHDIVLTGSDILIINETGEIISAPKRPVYNNEIQFSLIFKCTLANPSLMYRKNILDKYGICYEVDYLHAEDFRLITRMSKYGKVFNIEKPLVKYRKHGQNNSKINYDYLNNGSIMIVKENLINLGLDVSEEQIFRIRNLMSSKGIRKEFVYDDVNLVFNVIKKYRSKHDKERNEVIIQTLKRMLNWLGRKNLLFKLSHASLYKSILGYYFKEAVLRRN